MVGIGEASFKTEDKAGGGVFLFVANSSVTKATSIYWKSKQIDRVCLSSKDVETLNLLRMVEDSVLAAPQLEILLFGEVAGRVRVCLFTDS